MITSMISDKALKIPANIREKIRANMLKELLYSLEAEV
jgi:transcriptional regulator CtsR